VSSEEIKIQGIAQTIKLNLAVKGEDVAVWSDRATYTGQQFLVAIEGYERVLAGKYTGKKVVLLLETNHRTLALFVDYVICLKDASSETIYVRALMTDCYT